MNYTSEEKKQHSFDNLIKIDHHLTDKQFEDYIERVGICTEAGVPEAEAVQIALKQVGKS